MDCQAILEKLSSIETMLKEQAEQFVPLEEAARRLNLSQSYLYKLTSGQEIPFFKPNGKKIFFRISDLNAWITRDTSQTHHNQQA